MRRNATPILAAILLLTASAATLFPIIPRVTGDPLIVDNLDGNSTAIWDFSIPGDYVLTDTEIINENVTLKGQPAVWWNSTSAADFAGPDGETNIDRAKWPGDVTMALTSGPGVLLTLQPGASGEDTWLDKDNTGLNYGSSTTMTADSRNPYGRPIIRFDLSSIPANVVIDGARLSLYQISGIGNPFWATARQITSQWDEAQATWDNRLTGVAWTTKGGDFTPRNYNSTYLDNNAGWRAWNITSLVDLWHRGILPNYGLIFDAFFVGADSDKVFLTSDYLVDPTRRPKLEIWYRTLGATAEYVSKIGGPGSEASWRNISWNPSVRELASDEFNGAGLDPKWTWLRPPASFDMGVTTPGHLHVTSGTGTDFNGGTFTGHALVNDVVGDFTITMKFSVNPVLNGQKSGIMVMVNERNWYGIAKANVGGVNNWRVYATDDSTTTIRADVASGNPIPSWLRVQRVGNVFTASSSTDGSGWTLQDTYAPPLEYTRSVRTGFSISDGMSGTALSADVDYIRVATGSDATVTVQTRIGDVVPVDATWSAWSPPYPVPSSSSMSNSSRYIQYRLSFSVSYPDHVPVIGDVNISWSSYLSAGTVETNDLVPGDLNRWETLTATESLNGQIIAYEYSIDSGSGWTSVTIPADLSGLSTATGKIRIRANLSTSNTIVSPQLIDIRVKYRHKLDHFYVTGPSTANAGAPFSISVSAKDRNNNTIVNWTGTVNLAAYLTDGTTPGGGTLGTMSLAITSGGTATLPTETYTKAETILINASFGSSYGWTGPIVVLPGPVARIDITPNNVTILAFDSQAFAASAYDSFDNPVPGINFTWTVGGAIGGLNVTWGQSVLFTSNPPAANGTLEASNSSVVGTAQIQVTLGASPQVSISSPLPGAHVTGSVPIVYTNSTDSVSIQFDYDDGTGWTTIGTTGVLSGTYLWDTSILNFTGGSLRAIVTNNRTATGGTLVTPIEVDNAPPVISLGAFVDDQAGSGTITLPYVTDADIVRVDFSYYDGSWNVIGSDLTIDGIYVWSPGLPINGVTLLAVAVDEVDLRGATQRQGVGNRTIGTNPPTIATIPDIHVSVGLTYSLNLTFYVSDPDTPLASLGVSVSDAANVTVNAGQFPSLDIVYNQAGMFPVTLWVSDGVDTAWTIVRITASATGPPALIFPLPVVMFDEDATSVNALGAPATTFFSDPDLDPLTFQVLDAVVLSFVVNGDDTIDIWAPANWSGSETLRLRAADPSGGFAESAFLVIVGPMNDNPVLITSFPDVSFDEDTLSLNVFGLNATINFFDIDGDQLTISVLGGTNVLPQVNLDGTIDLTPLPDWHGTEFLRVRATDLSGSFAEDIFLVTVLPVNDAPFVIPPIPTVTFDEDTTSANPFGTPATSYFGDIDLDTLTFTVLGGINVFSSVNANDTVDFWASGDWYGSEILTLRATDPSGTFAEDSFLVTVRPVNDAPVLVTAFATVTFDEDATSLDSFGSDAVLHFFDVDLDILTISVLDGVNVLSRVNANGTIDFWAVANWSGSETLRIRATDPSGAFSESSSLVNVLPVNDLPTVIASLPSVNFDEDTVAFDVLNGTPSTYFFDRDGDSLAYMVLGGPEFTSRVNADLTIDLWASTDWFGSATLRIRATEPSGGFVEASLLVDVLPVNDAPTLAPIGAIEVKQGEAYSLDLTPYVNDVDTNISLINATTDSQFITVNGFVLNLIYPDDLTEVAFTVTISDGAETDSQEVRVTFIPPIWKNPIVLSMIPFGIILVVGMIAQRARWKPVKAFLVDERLRLLREFTLDPRCDVSYEQACNAGAMDAVEKPVKVQRYHAQTVRGDALAVCLLGYGPVSLEQVEFAREMLVNVQDKFDEGVKERLEAAKTTERKLEDRLRGIHSERETFNARSKAVAGIMDATLCTMSKLSKESSIIHEKEASFSEREERLKQQEQDVAQEVQKLESQQETMRKWAQDIIETEKGIAESRQTLDTEFERLTQEKREFDERRKEGTKSVSAREMDFDARMQSVIEKESTLQSQEDDYEARFAELNRIDSELKEGKEELRKAQERLAARESEVEEISTSLEARTTSIQEMEKQKSDEFHSWQEKKESELALLRRQQDAFNRELTEENASIESRLKELRERETKQSEQAMSYQNEKTKLDREREALIRREEEVQRAMQTVEEIRAKTEVTRNSFASRESEMEKREQTIREEALRLSEEFAQRLSNLKAAEAEMVQRQSQLEEKNLNIARQNDAWMERLSKMADNLEAKDRELAQRKAACISGEAVLREWETRLNAEEKDFEATQKRVETKELEIRQSIINHADESERFQKETEAVRKSLAEREAALEERRLATENAERDAESRTTQMDEAAKRLGERETQVQALMDDQKAREERLNALEAELSATSQKLASERSALDQESQRLGKLATEIDAQRAGLEEREAEVKERQIELTNREQGQAFELQRVENLSLELQQKEADIQSREQFVQSVQNDISKRETILSTLEAEVRRKMEELERNRTGIDAKIKEIESARAEAERLQKDVIHKQDMAEKEKAEAESMQKELKKNIKFLQKKALEILAKESKLRVREKKAMEAEMAAQTQKEQMRSREREVNAERKELEQRLVKAESESKKLKEQLEKAGKSADTKEMQEWRQDIENRVRIVQKKAMDILAREERLRKKEDELKALAERLGVRLDSDVVVHQDNR